VPKQGEVPTGTLTCIGNQPQTLGTSTAMVNNNAQAGTSTAMVNNNAQAGTSTAMVAAPGTSTAMFNQPPCEFKNYFPKIQLYIAPTFSATQTCIGNQPQLLGTSTAMVTTPGTTTAMVTTPGTSTAMVNNTPNGTATAVVAPSGKEFGWDVD
jgi:hypothetical protein